MNNYYRSIPSEEHSDFESFYRMIADWAPAGAWMAELGISDGRGIILMASLMSNIGKDCHIWAVDDFSYGGDYQRNVVETNIRNSDEGTIEIIAEDSLKAVGRCQDGQFDFVFIDSSHLYELTKAEIRVWIHKLKLTGRLAGHDYQDNEQVRKAVDELIPKELLHVENTSNGHGVWWVEKKDITNLFR